MFLDAAGQDRLGLLYRIVLLRGPRRGEVRGLQWEGLDADDTGITVTQTVVEMSGEIHYDTPKTPSGTRWISLDKTMAVKIGEHRRPQRAEKGPRPANCGRRMRAVHDQAAETVRQLLPEKGEARKGSEA